MQRSGGERGADQRRIEDQRGEAGIIVFGGGGGGRGCLGRGCLFWIVLSVILTVLVNLVLLLFSGGGGGINV